ncbi:MAG: MgtC/SapB family protein [Planctomycetes bacterium]|nr:MgtC/SapB family protein [Planctomycetota bacterium]
MLQNDFDFSLARDFGTALLLGALVGIEREKRNTRTGHGHAGLRSFVLLSQIGALGGFLSQQFASPWILAATLLAATAMVLAGYFASARSHPHSIGLTTELAAVLTCMLGALVVAGHRELAIGIAVAMAAVLAYKQPLHQLVGSLGWEDVLAGLRLLLATFIVLPLLPDEAIDPWGAINPYKLWLLVLLISGLSLVGYIVTRWLGPGRGIAVTAAAGGLASSTAVTLTFVKQSHEPGAPARQLAGGILLAWSVMFGRVVVLATVVAPALFGVLIVPFAAMLLACAGSAVACLRTRGDATPAGVVAIKNPFSLWSATKFAAMVAIVQLLLKLAQQHLPQSGLYAVAALAGLTDVDAITLSMAQHARDGGEAAQHPAVVAIAIASVTNTLVKAGMVVVLARSIARPVLLATGALLVAGAVALLLG